MGANSADQGLRKRKPRIARHLVPGYTYGAIGEPLGLCFVRMRRGVRGRGSARRSGRGLNTSVKATPRKLPILAAESSDYDKLLLGCWFRALGGR